jgi:DNA-binding NtrC family response regulator
MQLLLDLLAGSEPFGHIKGRNQRRCETPGGANARHIPLNVTRRPAERPMDRFGSLAEVREAVECEYILKKLEETNGNVTRMAELLGLERSNLYRKMKTLGIRPKE